MIELWCYLEGRKAIFRVSILPTQFIYDLQKQIYQEACLTLPLPKDLSLVKVDEHIPAIRNLLSTSQYRPSAEDPPLEAYRKVNDVWPEQPRNGHLHVFVGLPLLFRTGVTNMLPEGVQDKLVYSNLIQSYQPIFINVNDWKKLEHSDLERGHIDEVQDETSVPNFVTNFERKLDRAPYLPFDARTNYEHLYATYFKLQDDSTTVDESHEEGRSATPSEMIHIANIASCQWEKIWQASPKRALEADIANAVFFFNFAGAPTNGMTTVRLNQNWPVQLIVKCEVIRDKNKQLRKYCPRSDFLISHSTLPRLLVEINSTSDKVWPKDLVRMLLQGAAIVRFANTLNAFRQEMNFVLCSFFIWDNGIATRYTLFQTMRDQRVYYRAKEHSLNDSAGRIEFTRQLYNALHIKVTDEEDKDTRNATTKLRNAISNYPEMLSLYSTPSNGTWRSNRKRTRTGDSNGDSPSRSDGGAADYADLRAHGYEVKPDVIVDIEGDILEPLFQMPSHIYTVYRPLDSNKELIAKKVWEGSKELDIFDFLNSIQPKSNHVISLLDSFRGQSGQWAILPKMDSIADYLAVAPNELESKVVQVCLGLIEGLAYLHKHCIAHRDIKPANLLIDHDFCLKIIDFDAAMRLQDEDEEIGDRRGTKTWMAPEVEMKLWHSPIKADRWACGRVILLLVDKFRKEDESLRVFARKLMAYYPKERPSLLEWFSHSTRTPLSEIGNVRKADETGQAM